MTPRPRLRGGEVQPEAASPELQQRADLQLNIGGVTVGQFLRASAPLTVFTVHERGPGGRAQAIECLEPQAGRGRGRRSRR